MNEARARALIAERSTGNCEVGCGHRATDYAHRLPKGMGGGASPWSPTNALHLCHACHMGSESQRALSYACGWLIRTGTTQPHDLPALVWTQQGPGWWLPDADACWTWVDPSDVPWPLDGSRNLALALRELYPEQAA